MERDKKNFEKMDFCSYPPAHLIDFSTPSGNTARVQNYLLKPLDFTPLSTYFINTYPAVLQFSYRVSGAALQNT